VIPFGFANQWILIFIGLQCQGMFQRSSRTAADIATFSGLKNSMMACNQFEVILKHLWASI
jgi:hypothetical protein